MCCQRVRLAFSVKSNSTIRISSSSCSLSSSLFDDEQRRPGDGKAAGDVDTVSFSNTMNRHTDDCLADVYLHRHTCTQRFESHTVLFLEEAKSGKLWLHPRRSDLGHISRMLEPERPGICALFTKIAARDKSKQKERGYVLQNKDRQVQPEHMTSTCGNMLQSARQPKR